LPTKPKGVWTLPRKLARERVLAAQRVADEAPERRTDGRAKHGDRDERLPERRAPQRQGGGCREAPDTPEALKPECVRPERTDDTADCSPGVEGRLADAGQSVVRRHSHEQPVLPWITDKMRLDMIDFHCTPTYRLMDHTCYG